MPGECAWGNQVPWAPCLARVGVRGQFCALSFIWEECMVVVLGGDSGNVDVCGGIAYGERFIQG